MFPVTSVIQSLVYFYCTPNDHTNTISIGSLQMYSCFLILTPLIPMLLQILLLSQPPIRILHKKITLNTLKSILSKKDFTHPLGPHHVIFPTISIIIKVISDKFIHKNFGCASHHRIQNMAKLGIYISLPKKNPKLQNPYFDFLIYKFPHLPQNPTVSTNNLGMGTFFTWSSASS